MEAVSRRAARVPRVSVDSGASQAAAVKRGRSGRFTRGRAERVADAVALHPPPECDAGDTERRRRALPVPAVLLEHAQDTRALVHTEAGGDVPRAQEVGDLGAARAGQDLSLIHI